jgi:hypothetical protein
MRLIVCFAVAMGIAGGAAWAEDDQLAGDALRKAVAGRTVSLETPLGALPINFRIDGSMQGTAGELATYTGSDQDNGRWWIAADRLCQRWNKWLGGRSYCFTLRQRGRSVHWTRSDGLTGMATIRR